MEALENGQRLPVVAQRLVWLLHVQVPVADAVEAARVESRVIERLRQDERPAKPWFCLRIVLPCPQKTQVNCTLPFCHAIMHRASFIQCPGVIMLCLFKFAKRFMCLPACAVRRG